MENRSTKQRVLIKEKATSDNRKRLYLVWFQNGKRTWESTNEFIFEKPKGLIEREHNKEVKIKVEALRNLRETQMFTGEIDDAIQQRKNKSQDFYIIFANYIDNYDKKDKRVMAAVYNLFKEFAPPPLNTKQVDEVLCLKFKGFLDKRLNGESPSSYFARFKKFLTYISKGKDRAFKENPSKDIKNTKKEDSVEKDTLTIEEIKKLVYSECGNSQVKMAFLFACNTGLRFVDIKILKWKNIHENAIYLRQNKTKVDVEIFLNQNAKKFLGNRGNDDDLVFKLPSHNATLKNLGHWANRAGIDKHITFHSARHTFGTLLAYYESDILTISKLMGHTSLRHTTKYVRIADEMKKKAVNSIPEI